MATAELKFEHAFTGGAHFEGWQQHLREILVVLRDGAVSDAAIYRMLKRRKWTEKELRRVSLARGEDLRWDHRENISRYEAESLVFLNKSIFNEDIGWPGRAYGPIG